MGVSETRWNQTFIAHTRQGVTSHSSINFQKTQKILRFLEPLSPNLSRKLSRGGTQVKFRGCRRVPQTLTLFTTNIVHFAPLFNGRDVLYDPDSFRRTRN